MPKYLVKLQYFGKNYCGSQKQNTNKLPKQNTIQEELEKALSTLIKQNISTIFSGRTDAKVSALGQTAHFNTDAEIDIKRVIYSLNAILPKDIAVSSISKVDNEFHAQMSAKFRHYQYKIRTAKVKSPFDLNVTHLGKELNLNNLNKALHCIVGEHDFSAFKSTSTNPAVICKIFKAEANVKGDYIIIDIIGNRFLYNMVRTIVGTLLLFEKNGIEPLTMKEILNSKNRSQAGPTANPIGLTLIEVGYENKYE